MSNISEVYEKLLADYQGSTRGYKSKLNILSYSRLAAFAVLVFFIVKLIQAPSTFYWIGAATSFVAFFVLLRVYNHFSYIFGYHKAFVTINENEIAFLQGEKNIFSNGKQYADPQHAFSFDLDLFGEGSLFEHLNRCTTREGENELAKLLLSPKHESIMDRQAAIDELGAKLDFRQAIHAHGLTKPYKEENFTRLNDWLKQGKTFRHPGIYYSLCLLPILTFGLLIMYFIKQSDWYLNAFYSSFTVNLIVAFSFARSIKNQLQISTGITDLLKQLHARLNLIEKENFNTPLNQHLQESLFAHMVSSSKAIQRLYRLFDQLETIANLLVAILLNGLFLYHVHILYGLQKWKANFGQSILHWFTVVGQLEALNSLGNLHYNNPSYCLPILTEKPNLQAQQMAHPLLADGSRVANNLAFDNYKFVVLTGSNMSGKSTFLRTLGVNLVLAKAGARVCAQSFHFHPMPILISMHISDSLQDSASLFYAELLRLQQIIQATQQGPTPFIILDEILRGTNSNDKQKGTMELIRKMVSFNAIGIIATHDIAVTELEKEFPERVESLCFESEIVDGDLLFDYTLKKGAATKLNASYLMKKMGIIG